METIGAFLAPPVVSRAWLGDVAALLTVLCTDDGCYCEMEFICLSCRARDLLGRAPIEAITGIGERHYATGRMVETVATGVLL